MLSSARRALPGFLLALVFVGGCGRFVPKPKQDYVYVSAKGTFLRDRLAAVSNRVAEVTNGQRLAVLEHNRRFFKVKTEKNEVGWVDEHAVITQQVFDQFEALKQQHAHDALIATGTLRDDSYLHVAPGRKTDRYLLLSENAKLQMLVRASVEKPVPAQAVPVPKPIDKPLPVAKKGKQSQQPQAPAGPPMQDWWLVRDGQGNAGWVLSRMIDIDIPDEISGLAEGQRYVGAYRLTTVNDPDSNFPDKKAPEYVVLLNSWKDGLPYDFDQVRVFTWNTRKHRYETAFRDRNLEGYLPVTVGSDVFNGQTEPTFSFKVADGDDVSIDPASGATRPAKFDSESYRMEGVLVKRVGGPAAATPAVAKTAPSSKTKPERTKRHHPPVRRKKHR
ncbi:SH3 domain-containing protein [Silvibacterium acidisoli]|uniref:SH3 domain-containing protein n=1 Tax=Acidobacteriaceae bacterium ZG23-2 TaxID=2883246 RepID=UPI00406C17C8